MTDYGDMCKDLREMRREIAKQARLLGIGGTRESALMAKVDAITRERDEARAALRMIADGDLYNADGMRTIACKALAATEAKPVNPDGLPTYDKEKALEWVAQLRDGNKEAKP